eukprot:3980521-Amphidinium_carterae.1
MSLLSGSLRERKTNYRMVWPMKLGLLNPPTRLAFVQGEVQKTTEELGFSAKTWYVACPRVSGFSDPKMRWSPRWIFDKSPCTQTSSTDGRTCTPSYTPSLISYFHDHLM